MRNATADILATTILTILKDWQVEVQPRSDWDAIEITLAKRVLVGDTFALSGLDLTGKSQREILDLIGRYAKYAVLAAADALEEQARNLRKQANDL